MTSPLTGLVVAGLLILLVNAIIWAGYSLRGARRASPTRKWGIEDVDVRVVSRDSATESVRETVESVPDGAASVHVVGKQKHDIDSAVTHVLPEDFECDARAKGRLLEWARRNLPSDGEYALYIDAGTVVSDFNGLPDSDLVQFRERPVETDSRLTWLSDLLRSNGVTELVGYSYSNMPLFVWSGGLAVRHDTEEDVTWNRDAINSGSAFAWEATRTGHTYQYITDHFIIQSAGSVISLAGMKRKWYSGRVHDSILHLPHHYWLFISFRSIAWTISTFFTPLVATGLLLTPITRVLALGVIATTVAQAIVGWRLVNGEPRPLGELLVALPVVTVVDGLGYVYGMLNPVDDYKLGKYKPEPKAEVEAEGKDG